MNGGSITVCEAFAYEESCDLQRISEHMKASKCMAMVHNHKLDCVEWMFQQDIVSC